MRRKAGPGYTLRHPVRANQRAISWCRPSKKELGAAETVESNITYQHERFRFKVYSDANWGSNQDNGDSSSLSITMNVQQLREFRCGHARDNGPANYKSSACGERALTMRKSVVR